MPAKSRYVMIGGFLGAGKSTSILRLAKHLSSQGSRVGLITNDQGQSLVDTAFLASNGFPVQEIAGGCFCCRFNSLVEAAETLTHETRPDVIIAEPVGSCTDLVATVTYPLRRIYGDNFSIAPLSVIVDPVRALRIFEIEGGRSFSEKVVYVYRKQLEEADLIVINKSDLLRPEQMLSLRQRLSAEYPGAGVYICSARNETGLDTWFDAIEQTTPRSTPLEINYETYGEGEALLGWLNATIALTSATQWDGNHGVLDFASQIKSRLDLAGAEIAHLKMTLSPNDNLYGDIAVVNLVRNDHLPEVSQSLPDQLTGGQLIVNLRAEAEPNDLRAAVEDVFKPNVETGLPAAKIEHLECFKPSPPVPVHRDVVSV